MQYTTYADAQIVQKRASSTNFPDKSDNVLEDLVPPSTSARSRWLCHRLQAAKAPPTPTNVPTPTPPKIIKAPDPPIMALVQVAKRDPATTLPIPACMPAAILPGGGVSQYPEFHDFD